MFQKYKVIFLISSLALSACVPQSAPPSEKPVLNSSGAALEEQTSKGLASLVFRTKTTAVNTPAATARKRLAAFAKQCVDQRSVVIEGHGGGFMGSGYSRTTWHFRAQVASENGIDRLLVLGDADSDALVIGDKDGFNVILSTQILPNGQATSLKTRHVMFWGRMHDAAVQWASGEASVCPDLTKLFKPI